MSVDGSIVAVGVPFYNNDNGNISGHVRVFELSVQDQDWVQRGGDIDGEERDNVSGWSVALSKDGSTIIIGALLNDGNGDRIGHVCMYHYNTTDENWVQCGDDINGEAAEDLFGYLVDVSGDGTIVTIGSPFNDENNDKVGSLNVYEFDIIDNRWVQRAGLDDESENDFFGLPCINVDRRDSYRD